MSKRRFYYFLFFLLLLISGLSANGQVQLKANDKAIRYDLIRPSHTLYKAVFFDTSGNETRELVIDHSTQVDTAKKEIEFINSVPFAPGKMIVDTSIEDYQGSKQYALATYPSTKAESIVYKSSMVEARNVVEGMTTTKTTAMQAGYFDDNSIWDILGVLPLKKGTQYLLDCYGTDIHTQVSIPYTIEYIFEEKLQSASGGFSDNMVLKVCYSGSIAYVWVDKKRHIMTKEFVQGPGYSFTRVTI